MSGEELLGLCAGNADAAGFCSVFVRWVRWIDDAQDGDVSYPVKDTVRINLEAMAVFSRNAFFQANREGLLALIAQAFLAWENGGGARGGQAVLQHVALLCGGLEHARVVAAAIWKFNHDYDLSARTAEEQ